MEQEQKPQITTSAPDSASAKDVFLTPKKPKGLIVATVAASVIALASVTFTIVTLVKADRKSTEISDLRAQVEQLSQTNSANDSTPTPDSAPDATTPNNTIVPEDYFYVSDWGIKIKKPENYTSLIESYEFYNGYPQAVDDFAITLRASNSAKVSIYKDTKTCAEIDSNSNIITCISLGNYSYVVQQLVAGFEPAEPISENLRAFFANAENYSEI